jgi:hypothetical protein
MRVVAAYHNAGLCVTKKTGGQCLSLVIHVDSPDVRDKSGPSPTADVLRRWSEPTLWINRRHEPPQASRLQDNPRERPQLSLAKCLARATIEKVQAANAALPQALLLGLL